MSKSVYVLGVSMSNHDRSACLIENGVLCCAIAEERLDRRKRSEGFYRSYNRGTVVPPLASIRYVLRQKGIGLDDVDLVVCGRSMRSCRDALLEYLPVPEARVAEPSLPGHHLAHAYSAYATSPFEETAVLVIDEQGHHYPDGRFEKCSWFEGSTGPLTVLRRFEGTAGYLSLGMFYNVFAAFTGLSEAGQPAAGKLMGLAPFGADRPDWAGLIRLDAGGETCIPLAAFEELFARAGLLLRPGMDRFPVRELDDLLAKYQPMSWDTEIAKSLARKAQEELERAVLHVARALRAVSSATALSYAGGVALNCTVNARLREAGWSDVFVHPAATDDGAAIGLAFYGWIEVLGHPRRLVPRFNPFTGRRYRPDEATTALRELGLDSFARETATSLEGGERVARGEVVCWFQGASEWGPRALGGRSIVANPTVPGVTTRLNATVKHRESFRPFAISGTMPQLASLVDMSSLPPSLAPYMLAVAAVRDVRLAPVCHVDGTVRVQLVMAEAQPEWHALIEEFGARTGVHAVLNTSFNTLGEPLVETPADALRQFLLCGADVLILDRRVVALADIPADLLEVARMQAWRASRTDPLAAALALEASGYPEVARAFLERVGYGAEQAAARGGETIRSFHAIQFHAARRCGDTEAAAHHAEEILRWSSLPREARQAAAFLAEAVPDDERRQFVGRLVGSVAGRGAALRFFTSLYASDDGNTPVAPIEATAAAQASDAG